MKTNKYIKSFVIALAIVLGASLFVLADGAKAPMATGGFVGDASVSVPANAYVTFSTLYNGHRYYLGVDTVLAKTGKDTVLYYESPNYATMWIAGPLWSPTGNVLANKDYTRTIQSVWLKEHVSRDRYLALGTGSGTYSTLRLLSEGTMWHTEKDSREQNRYINGFLYYYSDATGIDVYRYLRYDPVYGFSRLYAEKPAASQRISVWDRKTGSDLIFDIQPKTFTFGWETNGNDTTKQPITSQVIYYENVDRFRSRFDQVDVYAHRSTPITDQNRLVTEFGLFGYYEWKSNPLGEGTAENVAAYDGLSRMKVYMPILNKNGSENEADWTYEMGWADSTMVYVKEDGFKRIGDVWYDTIYAIGSAPIDRPNARFLRRPAGGGAPTEGTYVNHNDVLYVKFTCGGKNYVDSMAISRHTFHDAPYTTMSTLTVPTDHTFPYTYNNLLVDGTGISATDTAYTFTVSASYVAGNKVTNAVNAVVSNYVGEEMTLDLTSPGMKCIRDTIWEYDEDGNPVLDDDKKPKYSDIILYDTLLVEALLADGVTNAVYGAEGASADSWIESVQLASKNQIRVRVKQSSPDVPSNRIAQLRYTYRYWHSSAQGDQVTSTRTIWLVQKWSGEDNDKLYTFNHKSPIAANGLQAVHEKEVTMYAIPEEDLALPLHRDLWGYYRWFVYDGTIKDRDLENDGSWIYVTKPKNNLGSEFMPINITTSPTSRGQWDIAIGTPRRFALNTATPSPVIRNENTSKNHIKIACDVSAYKDVKHEGEIGVSLKSVTEPTLSYRQIFDVQPAATQADKMGNCRVNGAEGHNGYMETHTVVAPAGRALTLSPQYPIAANVSTATEPAYTEDELQYIYYFNPDAVGTTDNNMGKKEGIADLTQKEAFARIGKKYKAGTTLRKARLLTLEDINKLERPTKVFVVNPRRNGGYILGGNALGGKEYKSDILNGRTDTADLRKHIEDDILNSGSTYSNYVITLTKTSNNHITLKSNAAKEDLYAHKFLLDIAAGVDWGTATLQANNNTIELVSYTSTSSDRISNIDPALLSMSMSAAIAWAYDGSLTAYSMEWYNAGSFFNPNYKYRYNRPDIHLDDLGDDDAGGEATINQGWCFYEIIEPEVPEHFEVPQWEKSTNGGSSWTQVARWNYSTNTSENTSGYNMRPDGSLEIDNTVHTLPNETVLYRLRTQHFNLLYMPLVLRDPNQEGPKEGAPIISEEDIEANYTVLFDLGMDQWSKPGTTGVVAHTQPMPWDFTELSFHYPRSVIADEYRDTLTEMPLKGEYALLNKFVVPEGGKNTGNVGAEYEARSGAANGYMMVVNADSKRTTIMRFDYPTLSCSNQQIYLVGDYCNPIDNPFEPQITADLEGSNDGIHWTEIYRFKTGKIPYNKTSPWYQMALPIDRDKIKGYRTFRCTAMLDGATNKNAHLLIDRLRFIERTRSFNVFQSKAACVKDDSVSVLLRVDFAADPDLYMPGKLVAYQLQKWNASLNDGKGGYEPMSYSQVKPGYVKDGFTVAEGPKLKSQAGNDYGYIYVPETTYNPQNSESSPSFIRTALVTQAADSLRKWGNITTDEAYNTRINNFKKETGNVVSFEDVMSEKALFGGATPHIKSYVKEGDKWVVYVACRLRVEDTQNGTFRVGMTVMNNLDDKPTFVEESCASFRVLNIKQATSLLIDGEDWLNKARATLKTEGKLLAPNENYRASIKLTVPDKVEDNNTKNPRCKFDLIHATQEVRANDAMFQEKYGCTRDELVDALNVFRSESEGNILHSTSDWSKVKPSDFEGAGRTAGDANTIYNRLDHLVKAGLLELALDYRDIYMGDRADSYFYLIPVPATGLFDVTNGNASKDADTTLQASVCNDTIWLELHSLTPDYKLRYGFDSRVGDTFIVPTIRASKTDANSTLNVRVAFITDEADKATVIGYDSTRLVETNDPDWTAADPDKEVLYRQDKNVLSPAANLSDYYNNGDIVHFAKQGTYSLKAGYWYRFESAFFGTATPSENYAVDETSSDNVKGHTSFILAVAPDTVRWTPAHSDAANYWNDDENWTPVMHNTPDGGFLATVPMADTKVIIPQEEEGLAPILSELVEDQKDTLHFGYVKNTCSAILFYPNAQILGQEKLNYDKAYVDVPLKTGNWQTFSPALDDIYAGDMYIPFATSYNKADPASGASTDNVDFEPKPFPFGSDYNGTYNPRVYPFAFYQGFYNSSVPVAFYNTDEDDLPVATTMVQSKNSVDWVRTNALDMQYAPGKACILTGYDASDVDGNSIVVRLPKPDDIYYGFGRNGGSNYIAGSPVTISRPNKLNRNLAYDQYAAGFHATDGLTYTLTNETESEIFFFGNPTMSLIDVYRLCVDNADVLKHDATTYSFTAYNLIDGDNYIVKTITGPGQFFVAPQRAVGLIANDTQKAAKQLSIKLKPSALVAISGDGSIVNSDSPSPMPRRAPQAVETINRKRLYIAAANETDGGVKKAYLTLGEQADAQPGFRFGEDALSIASGINYYSAYSFSTPLAIYTIADNEALMQDVRDTLRCVPIVFTTMDDKFEYSPYTILSFALEGNWTEPVYLFDAVTNDSIRIADGLQIAVATPNSDQLRYYINGAKHTASSDEQSGTPTGIEIVEDETVNDQMANDQMVNVFDVLGRKVAVLGENDLLTRINLPTGVYVISRGTKTERVVIR